VDQQEFVTAVLRNPVNRVIVTRLRSLELSDGWLVSGALFQSVWNAISGLAPDYGIKDYDIFYFDPDLSWDAEDAVIKGASQLFADLGRQIEIRNQARVHLWYQEKFGTPYPPLSSTTQGIDRFLMTCAQVGIGHGPDGIAVYAPRGFSDIEDMIIRPNRTPNFRADNYYAKASRWQSLWPALKVMPA
jgi:hypothetical protein